jgi:hypothetical protein
MCLSKRRANAVQQHKNESYEEYRIRRERENDELKIRSKGWWFWPKEKGTYARTPKPEQPRPKRTGLTANPKTRHRKSGAEKRRDKANIVI